MFTVFAIIALLFIFLRVTFWLLRLKGRVLGFLLGGLYGRRKRRRQLPPSASVNPRELIDPNKFGV